MKRRAPDEHRLRVRHHVACWLALAFVACRGCRDPILRPQSPEARLDLPPMPDVKFVSEYTHPYGMNYVKVEAVSLVTGLAGTGSDPPPTPQRAALLDEMNRREVDNPERSARLAATRRWCWCGRSCGPAFRKAIGSTSKSAFRASSETTSLRDGWLLSTRLTEMAVLGEQIREGHVLGMAEGPVLVDPSADPKKDPALATRGRILGGGVALEVAAAGPGDQPSAPSRFASASRSPQRSTTASTRSSTAASKASPRPRPTSSSTW